MRAAASSPIRFRPSGARKRPTAVPNGFSMVLPPYRHERRDWGDRTRGHGSGSNEKKARSHVEFDGLDRSGLQPSSIRQLVKTSVTDFEKVLRSEESNS